MNAPDAWKRTGHGARIVLPEMSEGWSSREPLRANGPVGSGSTNALDRPGPTGSLVYMRTACNSNTSHFNTAPSLAIGFAGAVASDNFTHQHINCREGH